MRLVTLPGGRAARAGGIGCAPVPPPRDERPDICVLLLPRPLERFILRSQAEDLLRAPHVVAVDPPRLPYGAYGRLPATAGDALAMRQSARLVRELRRHRGEPRAVVIFHPLQYPLARAIIGRCEGCELWYGRWDRYERAYDADARMRERLDELHALAAARSALTFVVSGALADLETQAGRPAPAVIGQAADTFPAPDPEGTVVAVSLGHLGWRNDWALLRAVADRLGDRLVLLLVGAWQDGECGEDPDYVACREHPSLVWLGHQPDAAAARLILAADVGIVPFRREPFNDAGLPNRILKYARLGRRTVSPDLAGVRTWSRAVTVADGPEAFADALLAHAGARTRPDADLREWALSQTARVVNRPLWERLEDLGIARDA
jgi:glycosyltransferase involved in cell wall biosynthesis